MWTVYPEHLKNGLRSDIGKWDAARGANTCRKWKARDVYWKVVVLGVELAVSCTCNQLQQGLIPSGGRTRWSLRRRYGVESWVLRGEAS